jgi:hypothetical protein
MAYLTRKIAILSAMATLPSHHHKSNHHKGSIRQGLQLLKILRIKPLTIPQPRASRRRPPLPLPPPIPKNLAAFESIVKLGLISSLMLLCSGSMSAPTLSSCLILQSTVFVTANPGTVCALSFLVPLVCWPAIFAGAFRSLVISSIFVFEGPLLPSGTGMSAIIFAFPPATALLS